MNKWEYKIIETHGKSSIELERVLNRLGDDRWEVVSYDIDFGKILLKRCKSSVFR